MAASLQNKAELHTSKRRELAWTLLFSMPRLTMVLGAVLVACCALSEGSLA